MSPPKVLLSGRKVVYWHVNTPVGLNQIQPPARTAVGRLSSTTMGRLAGVGKCGEGVSWHRQVEKVQGRGSRFWAGGIIRARITIPRSRVWARGGCQTATTEYGARGWETKSANNCNRNQKGPKAQRHSPHKAASLLGCQPKGYTQSSCQSAVHKLFCPGSPGLASGRRPAVLSASWGIKAVVEPACLNRLGRNQRPRRFRQGFVLGNWQSSGLAAGGYNAVGSNKCSAPRARSATRIKNQSCPGTNRGQFGSNGPVGRNRRRVKVQCPGNGCWRPVTKTNWLTRSSTWQWAKPAFCYKVIMLLFETRPAPE